MKTNFLRESLVGGKGERLNKEGGSEGGGKGGSGGKTSRNSVSHKFSIIDILNRYLLGVINFSSLYRNKNECMDIEVPS